MDKAQAYGQGLSASGAGSQSERKKMAAETSNDNSIPSISRGRNTGAVLR